MSGNIQLVEYDFRWPQLFDREASSIRAALGDKARRLDHVGSTAVLHLIAKPIIDLVLEVDDSSNEDDYAPALEEARYLLRIREPGWFEHRMFKGQDADANLHVFSSGCPEVNRMVLFRDWLRSNASDRELYARTKSKLAARQWTSVQEYADAKTAVVGEIISRAFLDRK